MDVPELNYFSTDRPYPRGEVLVKTDTMLTEYFKDPVATAAAFTENGCGRGRGFLAVLPAHRRRGTDTFAPAMWAGCYRMARLS